MSVALVRAACTVLGESEIHIIRSYAHGKVYRLYGKVEGDSQKTDRADAGCDFGFVISPSSCRVSPRAAHDPVHDREVKQSGVQHT